MIWREFQVVFYDLREGNFRTLLRYGGVMTC